jgi:hypothetical protein
MSHEWKAQVQSLQACPWLTEHETSQQVVQKWDETQTPIRVKPCQASVRSTKQGACPLGSTCPWPQPHQTATLLMGSATSQ